MISFSLSRERNRDILASLVSRGQIDFSLGSINARSYEETTSRSHETLENPLENATPKAFWIRKLPGKGDSLLFFLVLLRNSSESKSQKRVWKTERGSSLGWPQMPLIAENKREKLFQSEGGTNNFLLPARKRGALKSSRRRFHFPSGREGRAPNC